MQKRLKNKGREPPRISRHCERCAYCLGGADPLSRNGHTVALVRVAVESALSKLA